MDRRNESGKTPPELEVRGFRSVYEPFRVEADFAIGRGERVAIHSPSGSGKSTLLRWMAGFTPEALGSGRSAEVNSGTLLFGGANLTRLPPEKRGFGVVLQNYALFPHWTALENLAFGLEMKGIERREREAKAREWLSRLGLEKRERVSAGLLSGGEKQRVALARALAWGPKALLLDEPFAALDLASRRRARESVLAILEESAIPTLFVTHDLEDVRLMATRTLEYRADADGNHHAFS